MNIVFDPAAFRALFPAFANTGCFSDVTLQAFFDTASAYVSPEVWPCLSGMSLAQQTLALNLMTAHVGFLFNAATNGQPTGIITEATIDKVRVTVKAPPVQNGSFFQFWLAQSPYGIQLLALLNTVAAGGQYIGGSPERFGFRSVGGGFGPRRW